LAGQTAHLDEKKSIETMEVEDSVCHSVVHVEWDDPTGRKLSAKEDSVVSTGGKILVRVKNVGQKAKAVESANRVRIGIHAVNDRVPGTYWESFGGMEDSSTVEPQRSIDIVVDIDKQVGRRLDTGWYWINIAFGSDYFSLEKPIKMLYLDADAARLVCGNEWEESSLSEDNRRRDRLIVSEKAAAVLNNRIAALFDAKRESALGLDDLGLRIESISAEMRTIGYDEIETEFVMCVVLNSVIVKNQLKNSDGEILLKKADFDWLSAIRGIGYVGAAVARERFEKEIAGLVSHQKGGVFPNSVELLQGQGGFQIKFPSSGESADGP
jgi:hypothetical protein